MTVGMLWQLKTDKKDLNVPFSMQVLSAAVYYEDKYGARPTTCHVHPDTLPKDKPEKINDITIKVDSKVLKNHLWIGVDEDHGAE